MANKIGDMDGREFAQMLADSINRGGSSGGFRGPAAPAASSTGYDAGKDLKELGQQAKDVEENIKKLSRQFLPFSGSLETARKLHGQMARDLDSINNQLEYLDTALDENRVGNEKISAASKTAMQEEQKRLKAMKATVEFETTKRESVGNMFGALGGISDAYQKIAMTAVEGMASISSAIQQGGSGFNLLGAAAEHQANMAQAQANMGASAMASVGQSMQGLGLAGQVAGGALNFLAQQVQHNAELRRAAARIRNQLFMNMGEKFSQSFMAAAGAGAVFAGGATAMNAALDGSRITLSEFGELVKRNNAAFANSGVSMEKLTKQVGATSAAFKKSGVDGQLFKLGLSFEQQADIIVDTASELNRLRISTGGAGANQEEIAKAAEQNARNTAFMAQVMGEEAKTRQKANREASEALAYKIKEAEMAKRIGADKAAAQTKTIDTGLPPEMRKIFNQLINFGTITDKDQAAAVEQNPAQKKMLFELKAAYERGELADARNFTKIVSSHSREMNRYALGNKAIAQAQLVSGNSAIQASAKNASEMIALATQNDPDKIAEILAKNARPGEPGAEPPKADPLGDAIRDAAITMNNFQKDMETYVVDNLPQWSKAMQDALQKMKDAYQGKVAGLNPLADKFAWLTEFMQKYGLIVMLVAQGMALLVAAAKLAAGGLAKLGAAGEMDKLKSMADKKKSSGKIVSSKDKKGKEYYHEEGNKMARRSKADFEKQETTTLESSKKGIFSRMFGKKEPDAGDADTGVAKKGMFGRAKETGGKMLDNFKALGNLGKVVAVAGPLINLAGGAMEFMAGQDKYNEAAKAGDEAKAFLDAPGKKSKADIEAAKAALAEADAAKKEAREEQGAGIGGAVGGVAGGAIGFALGGPIGAAVGSYLGEMAGSTLGKYVGPYWDSMSEKAGQMWASTKESLSKGWDSLSTATGEILSSMWKGIKEGWTWMKDMFSTIGKAIWNGIQQTPLFKLGSFIISGIAGAASGMATAMINGLKSAFDWMKTTIGNLIPDWMKNAATGVKNVAGKVADFFTGGDDKPAPAAAPAGPAPGTRSASGQVGQTSAPPEPTLSQEQLTNYAYSIYLGKNKIEDVPAKYRAQVNAMIKSPPKNWGPSKTQPSAPEPGQAKPAAPTTPKPAAPPPPKPAPAQPQSPTPTTNKTQAAASDAGKQGEAKRPPDASKPATTPATPGAAKPPEVSKSGQVSEKDVPRLLQENLKLMEYNAKSAERMVNILASINDNAKRTATASEKTARG